MADFSIPNSARMTTGQKQRVTVEIDRWKNNVMTAVFTGINQALDKAHQSAVEDAPVRAVFRKTGKKGGGLRRGQRSRTLKFAEANSEEAMRRTFSAEYFQRTGRTGGDFRAGGQRTGGRSASVKANNPYLRSAASRRGNPNSFAPYMLERGTSKKDVAEAREIFERAKELGYGRGQKLDMEPSPPVYGGRELTRGGKIRHRPARNNLSARGRYEERSGRAAFTDKTTGVTTLGGRLRKEIEIVRPTLQGNIIRGSVVSPTPYARFQEFGTRHNRATPYMRPAILKLTTSFRPQMVKALNRVSASRGR